jgi:hypothetical protein
VMTNGQGQFANGYDHVLLPLAARGFIVASVQSDFEVESRAKAMACTLRWLRKTWTAENGVTPNCDVILMGHSRGGEAAWLTRRRRCGARSLGRHRASHEHRDSV